MNRIDFHKLGAQLVVLAFAAGALYFSFSHITDLALRFGATQTEAAAAPFYVDGFMLLGRMAMSRRFTARTNAIGKRFLVGGALVSLAANIAAGQTLGSRVFGALVVAGFVLCEWLAGQFRTRAAKPAPKPEPAKRTGGRKCPAGCTCGRHNRKAPRTPKPPAAPVSPAPGGRMVGGLWVARTLDEARR